MGRAGRKLGSARSGQIFLSFFPLARARRYESKTGREGGREGGAPYLVLKYF